MVALATPIHTVYNQGQVVPGAKVYTYISGTTTPLTTYSNAGLTTPNANPIIADANGQVTIYCATTSNLRIDHYTSTDAFIQTIDPIYPAAFATGGAGGTEATIASAATSDLGSTGVNIIKITGTTGITSFGSSASVSNPIFYVRFTGALTITNSANIVCPGGVDITTTNGYAIIAQYLGSGVWQVLFSQPSTSSFPLTLISTQTISSAVASVDFISGISNAYRHYIVEATGVAPATNGVDLRARLYRSGAFLTTGIYQSAIFSKSNSGTDAGGTTTTDTSFIIANTIYSSGLSNASNETVSVVFDLFAPSATTMPVVAWRIHGRGNNGVLIVNGSGNLNSAGAVTGVQFYASSGNLAAGTFKLYGVL